MFHPIFNIFYLLDEEVSMESRLLCRAMASPLPSPTSQSQGDECEGAPGQQQQLCRHQKRRQSPSAVNIQSGRRSINDDDQNESAFTTPTSSTTSSNLMARPNHDNKAAAVMSDNSVAAAAPVDNDSNDRHLLPSQSGAGRTAETSGNSSGDSNDLHLLSSTVIFLGSSSSDNDQPCSSNDDIINYPPTKAPSAIVVGDKTSAGDADNLVKFKVFFHFLCKLKKLYPL